MSGTSHTSSSSNTAFDLVVIGGGPGGYVAAIRAAQHGLSVGLVEKAHLGGICLNWGCIPTKALLRSAEIYHQMQHAGDYGLSVKDIGFDIDAIRVRSRKVANRLSSGIAHLMKKNKITVITGHGKLAGGGEVSVSEEGRDKAVLTAKHIVIATGARARILPGMEPDGNKVWSYREALMPDRLPKSLIVVGSGAIGIEFASFYRTFGTEVTVVEMMERVLPIEDAEISELARKAFEKQGMKILTGAAVSDVKRKSSGVTATVKIGKDTQTLEAETLLSAVGIVGNTEDLGLERTQVQIERNQIKTNDFGATAEPGVYAIGDVAGAPWLAHKASHEATICIDKIAGVKDVHALDTSNIPGCTYCLPQIASVGMTEAAAKEAGYKTRIGRFPFMANGKAIALGETEGLVKTIFDDTTGALLGAHMIGAEVTEMIQGYAIARTLESTEAELMQTVFPHPTLSEMMHEATLDAYDAAIHI